MLVKKYPISACLIIKNEEATIERCIASLKPFVSEIIINDTGSTDNTLSLIKSDTDLIVFESDWKNDFSYSRNLCLDKASQSWILSIDADECLTDDFSDSFERCLLEKADGYLINIINFQKQGDLLSIIPHRLLRLFKNKKSYRFEGTIHEQVSGTIEAKKGVIKDSKIVIEHFGYQDLNKDRIKRNTSMLKAHLEVDTTDAYSWYQYGVTLFGSEKYKEAIDAFNNALIYEESKFSYDLLFTLYIKFAQSSLATKNYIVADEISKITLLLDIKNPFPYYIRASIDFETKSYDSVINNLNKVKQFNKGMWKINDYQVELDLGNAFYLSEKYDEAIKSYTESLRIEPESDMACYNLGNCFYKLSMLKEAKQMYEWAIRYNPNLTRAHENLSLVAQEV